MERLAIIETDRMYLRELTEDDFDALKRVLMDKEGNPRPDEEVHRWISWCLSSYEKEGFGLYATILKETGEMIGCCGLSMQPINDKWRPEIGYHIRRDYQRKGLGKEISRAIRDHFFQTRYYDELYSYMDIDNLASSKTAESNGMTFRYVFTAKNGMECKVYSITRDEWQRLKGNR